VQPLHLVPFLPLSLADELHPPIRSLRRRSPASSSLTPSACCVRETHTQRRGVKKLPSATLPSGA
jgi:hypothetical protein